MDFEESMELAVKGFEVAGVTILVIGSVAILVNAAAVAAPRARVRVSTSRRGHASGGPSCSGSRP